MKLTENDWLLINDIIYKIYNIKDPTVMRKTFLKLIRMLIPYDGASFYLADDDNNCVMDPVWVGLNEMWIRKYSDYFHIQDYKRWIFSTAQDKAIRATDLLPAEDREKQPYYQNVLGKLDLHYEVILSMAELDRLLGIVTLFRRKEQNDFSDRDMYILEILKEHLRSRISRELPPMMGNQRMETQADFDETYFRKQYGLTNRELEILSLLAGNEQNDRICEILSISMSTLRKHIVNIHAKLGVRNRVELYKALQGGGKS